MTAILDAEQGGSQRRRPNYETIVTFLFNLSIVTLLVVVFYFVLGITPRDLGVSSPIAAGLIMIGAAVIVTVAVMPEPQKPVNARGTHGRSQFADLASIQRSGIWRP